MTIHGILPALVTPLRPDHTLDTKVLEKLIEHLYRTPIDGLYVAGQTGEGPHLPVATRKQLTEVSVANSPAFKKVIIHVGSPVLDDAIELARHAASAGAHAVSSLPLAGPFPFSEVKEFYRRLAEASPLPLYVYHFSAYSQAITGVAQLQELLALPNVAGLKFTDYDLFTLSILKQQGANALYGRDEVLSAGLLFGADGGIGTFYNLVPQMFVDIYQHAKAGEWTKAQHIQLRIQELIGLCLKVPMLAAVKMILTWQGLPCGPCVSPRMNLTPDHERQLWSSLEAAGLETELNLKAQYQTP